MWSLDSSSCSLCRCVWNVFTDDVLRVPPNLCLGRLCYCLVSWKPRITLCKLHPVSFGGRGMPLPVFWRFFVSLSHSASSSGLILKTLPLLKLGGNLLLGAFVLMLLLMTVIMMEVATIITEPWTLTDRLGCARLCDLHYVSLDSSPSFKAGHTTPILQTRLTQVTSQVKSLYGAS